jgi:hypothetical protein
MRWRCAPRASAATSVAFFRAHRTAGWSRQQRPARAAARPDGQPRRTAAVSGGADRPSTTATARSGSCGR